MLSSFDQKTALKHVLEFFGFPSFLGNVIGAESGSELKQLRSTTLVFICNIL